MAYRFEKLSLIVAVALSSAAMIFCGQNLGDRNIKRIKTGIFIANKWLFILLGSITLVIFTLIFMEKLIPLEHKAFEAFKYYIIIILIANLFHGFTIVYLGILSGLKRTKTVFYINIVKCIFISLLITLSYYTWNSYISIFAAISVGNFFIFIITYFKLKEVIKNLE